MIKAVTLDCWGTLLLDSPGSDDERYWRPRLAGFERILKATGVQVRFDELKRAYARSGHELARIWLTRRDVPVDHHVTALLEALDPTLPERLAPGVLAALIQAYAHPALVVPPAVDGGARTALEELAARGLALGVVSNTMRTPGEVLRQILDRAGLLAPMKVLTFSDECGIRKPDPEIFLLTLRQVGVAPEEAVHVGDDPFLDVEGARDAGMAVIQVAADGRATAPVKPDAVIRDLHELPAALERFMAP
ncbi:MAG: HAD family hydrolase [Candidatus Rokuibacteriota bacterium]